MCLGTLVQDGLAHMRGVTWRAVPAKFKREILKYGPLRNLLGYLEKAFPSIYMPNKASVENVWQTQKLGGMKRMWLTVLWGSFDFIVLRFFWSTRWALLFSGSAFHRFTFFCSHLGPPGV